MATLAESLPDEILLEILSYLTTRNLIRCGSVSRRWQRLSKDKSLWQIADFSSSKIVSLRYLVILLESVGVRSLNLEHSIIEDPKCWTQPCRPNQVKMINLSHARISPRCLGIFMKPFSQLTSIVLRGCSINHVASKHIVANAQLIELDLGFCGTVSPTLYKMLFSGCKSLEFLDLSHTWKLCSKIEYIRSTSLRRLRVVRCNLDFYDVKRLLRYCPNLTHLDISFNELGPIAANVLKKKFPVLVEVICLCDGALDESENDYTSSDEWSSPEEQSD